LIPSKIDCSFISQWFCIVLLKLVNENENNVEVIKELNKKCVQHESELDDTKQLNKQLNSYVNELKGELNALKESYNQNLEEKCARIDSNEQQIKQFELELAKSVSKLDQANLQLNELKLNYTNQLKQVSNSSRIELTLK